MGNNASRESRTSSNSHVSNSHSNLSTGAANAASSSSPNGNAHSFQHSSRLARTRAELPFFSVGSSSGDAAQEPRRETKQERDARRAERERIARAKERERSLKEESVDGGYLVTLGTYVGPEDFSKPLVRQLMIERRLAPFWRGLNDHSESWTEHQLVAIARGLPLPAADEIPVEIASTVQGLKDSSPQSTSSKNRFAHPSNPSGNSDSSAMYTQPGGESQPTTNSTSTPIPLFRGRSKTLASFSSKNTSQSDVTSQEVSLPPEPFINGQPVEAYLYKDVQECPICFLYYPPYLNQTRCCDQPICSECFVQIKRPDPHPPEHLDPNTAPPPEIRKQEEEGLLVSEPASCPFCVQTEFGVTYDPPPFRRGLVYAGQQNSDTRTNSAAHSTRKRGMSISADEPSVITTDRVRPDWAKKLADARAQSARRSAAATALHNAAYMMGGNGSELRLGFGRRRRHLANIESPGSSGNGGNRATDAVSVPNIDILLAALEGQGSSRGRRLAPHEVPSSRLSSRGSRTEELEEIMMMEAIRLSIAAEEERKRKEEKAAAKEARREEKKRAKEQKKADKAAKKGTFFPSSASTTSLMSSPSTQAASAAVEDGKGKAKAVQAKSQIRPEPTGASDPRDTSNSHVRQNPVCTGSRPLVDQSASETSSSASSYKQAGFSTQIPSNPSSPSSNSDTNLAAPSATSQEKAGNSERSRTFGSLAAMVDKKEPLNGRTESDITNLAYLNKGNMSTPDDNDMEGSDATEADKSAHSLMDDTLEQKNYGGIDVLDGNTDRNTV